MKNPETITEKLKKNKAVYVVILISFLLGTLLAGSAS